MAEMERNRRGKASATRNGRRINKKTSADGLGRFQGGTQILGTFRRKERNAEMKYDKIVAMNQEKSRKKVDVLKEK